MKKFLLEEATQKRCMPKIGPDPGFLAARRHDSPEGGAWVLGNPAFLKGFRGKPCPYHTNFLFFQLCNF